MKQQLQKLLESALNTLAVQHEIELPAKFIINIDNARDKTHGDYASNIAMVLAKQFRKPPHQVAEIIIDIISSSDLIEKVEIAGPGFINFYIDDSAKTKVIIDISSQKNDFGKSNQGIKERIILEYVSANPTGPLHVGHGRATAIGASLANILKSQGYNVHQEYYVNDAGRQMNILAASVYLRYLQLFNDDVIFPVNAYKGAYINDIALAIKDKHQNKFAIKTNDLFLNLPADESKDLEGNTQGDKEAYIDAIIENIQNQLGLDHFNLIHKFGLDEILDDIRQDLAEFGVEFDAFFSEKSLFDNGDIEKGINALQEKGYIYQKEGATWFKSTEFGDDQDRVLKRSNGTTTYFASDVAYHWQKYDRNFTQVIDVFGADHHGYVARVKAAAKALGFDDNAIDVLLIQFAILYRGNNKVAMSTRSGEFVTLRELRQEVGKDAARFFYVMRKSNQHLDFDLDLAKSQSTDNPVFYIQYAHARVSSVLKNLKDKGYQFDEKMGLNSLSSLDNEHEQQLMNQLQKYGEMLALAARDKEPHQVAYYLRELANQFHTYYNAHQFIVEDDAIRNARICLVKAIQQVLNNGLTLIGVSSPEQM